MIDARPIPERFREYLFTLSLTDLRTFGRLQGVRAATQLKKEDLIEEIVNVLTGKTQPVFPKTEGKPVGAPPKNCVVNPEILPTLEEIRKKFDEDQRDKEWVMRVAAGEKSDEDDFNSPVYSGVLEIMQSGYGFLRSRNCRPTGSEDVFVPAQTIHSMQLRHGDYVSCTARPSGKNDPAVLKNILTVNYLPVGRYERRPHFDELTPQYPETRILLSQNNSSPALRFVDLFVPIGMGQRGLIVAPSRTGKSMLLKEIAGAISREYKDIALIVLLIGARPEEVTDFAQSATRAEIVSTTFDEGAQQHVHTAELAMEYAKRLVERGTDVVVLVDSINRLAKAYGALSEGADAYSGAKHIFGTARNTLEAGSLTVLATALSDSGSRTDDCICEEFMGAGNAEIYLSRALVERHCFPAMDIRRSGTRMEELLLSDKELKAERVLRDAGVADRPEELLKIIKKTSSNEELIARLPEWKKSFGH